MTEPAPAIRRFLERHATSIRDAVEADVADARSMTPAERWTALVGLCRSLAWLELRSPEERARVLEWRDPPHPTYSEIMRRLREGRAP